MAHTGTIFRLVSCKASGSTHVNVHKPTWTALAANRLKTRARNKSAAIKSKFADQMHFVGALVQSPRQTGAIAPTSPDLAALMASHLRVGGEHRVLELGPGTGSITRALLARSIAPAQLTVLEYDAKFCIALSRQFPGITIVNGDAFALADFAADMTTPFDCIVSGLPLLNFPAPARRRLLDQALDRGLPLGIVSNAQAYTRVLLQRHFPDHWEHFPPELINAPPETYAETPSRYGG